MEVIVVGLLLVVIVVIASGLKIVPQSQNFLIERLGRYHRRLEAGLHVIVPFVDRVRHKVDVLERQMPAREISTITLDNVTIMVTLAILYRITDPEKTMYRIQNVDAAIQTTVTGVVRSIIGRTDLDGVQTNRRELSEAIENDLRLVTEEWGIVLSRVEIIDVNVDDETKAAMQMQLNAERTRRAVVRQAEGEKEARQLQSEAELYAAQKESEARRIRADADAYAVGVVAKAIAEGGEASINFEIKKIQADAMKALGSNTNSKLLLIPSDLMETLSKIGDRLGNKP